MTEGALVLILIMCVIFSIGILVVATALWEYYSERSKLLKSLRSILEERYIVFKNEK